MTFTETRGSSRKMRMDQQEMDNSEGRWKVGVCVYVLERLSGYGGTVRGKSTKKMKEGRGNSQLPAALISST